LPKEAVHKRFGRSIAIVRNKASTKSDADETGGQVMHGGMEGGLNSSGHDDRLRAQEPGPTFSLGL
jgi:hypothetical protein